MLQVRKSEFDGEIVVNEIAVGGWNYHRYRGNGDVVAVLRALGFDVEDLR